MALAFRDKTIYSATTVAELSQLFPDAVILLDSPRDLFIASWPSTIHSFVEKHAAVPQNARLLNNNPNYWFEALGKLAIKINTDKNKNAIKRNFTFNTVAPIVTPEASMNEQSVLKDERKRKHLNKSAKIEKRVQENPRRKGTHGWASWEKIVDGMSVAEYLQLGGRGNDLAWELKKGHAVLTV